MFRPAGVIEPGTFALGSLRNLGDPAVSRYETSTHVRRKEGRADGPSEVRAPAQYRRSGGTDPRDPVEGRRVSDHGIVEGEGKWEH